MKKIIKALRCATKVTVEENCEGCPYRVLEEVNSKLPFPADVEIDGEKYWKSCNHEKIINDAAEILENLEKDCNIICDKYCKFPYESTQEELEEICEKCILGGKEE